MLFPVGRVVRVFHVEVLVTGQNVHALVPVVAGFQQLGIDAPSGLSAPEGLVHAGRDVVTIRQRFVHAGDDGRDRPVGDVARQRALEPRQLRVVDLLVGGVVEKVEGDAAIDPVVVALDAGIGRCVFLPLCAQDRRVEPRGKCSDVLFASFGLDDFVVADADEVWDGTERRDLAGDEVLPLHRVVVIERQRRSDVFRLMLDVCVGSVRVAKVAQVPVKRRAIPARGVGNGGHHDVAAITSVAGDDKPPLTHSGRRLCGLKQPGRSRHHGHEDRRVPQPVLHRASRGSYARRPVSMRAAVVISLIDRVPHPTIASLSSSFRI